MFLINAWYVGGFSTDLAPGASLARRICNVPLVIFRTASGQIAALEDRCSHRSMPLSKGAVDGEIIRCCYHGLEFDGLGICTRIPGQTRVPAQANLRSYAVVERNQMIWIWMGEAAQADPARILPNDEHDHPDWSWRPFTFHVKANWQLLVDNILDLTHLAYVHAGTIGGNAQMHFAIPNKVVFDGERVRLIRHMPASPPPPTYVAAWGFEGLVDRWQEVDFEPRRGLALRVNAGACEVGAGAYEGHRDGAFALLNVHGITPETETTTHYIWSIATNAPRERGTAEVLFDQFYRTIREDEVVLEAQQERLTDFPNTKFVGISSDGAANQARRLIDSMQAAEAPPLSAVG